MKMVRSLLIFYAFFLITAPLIRIAGHIGGIELISRMEYMWAVVFFIAALVIYLARKKRAI